MIALVFLALVSPVWSSSLPTTGSAPVYWEWEAYEPGGFCFYHVLTRVSYATITQGDFPSRVRVRCIDALGRAGPWSLPSETFTPEGLRLQWAATGAVVGRAPLTMTVAFARTVEAAWPDSLRGPP